MADFKKLIGHTLRWEGGKSADPRDTGALRYGSSGVNADPQFPNNPVHTNKGIIWGTYLEYCKKKGKLPNASEFLEMPERIWLDIYKTVFWDSITGDKVNSQAVAEILMESRWIGGPVMFKALVRTLQDVVGAPEDGKWGKITLDALNSYTKTKPKETKLVDALLKRQLQYYQGLSNWSTYKNGWVNRIEAIRVRAYDAIAKGLATNTGKAVFVALVLGSLAYLYRDKLSSLYKKSIKTLR
jgi:lysozyme family protein